jgi:2-dehydro-3-deoxyphosphogluconate aldolase/(4S)-4-hydroxy-2-oxoglutarate aldolase
VKKFREKTIELILKHKIIAIMRNVEPKKVVKTVEALYNGGIKLIEVTFNQNSATGIEDAIASIGMIAANFGDKICVGAGTVINLKQLSAANESEVQYIISPNACSEVIKKTVDYGMVSIPGAMSSTEIINAYHDGADFVKIFPAANLGVNYIKAIASPINHIPLLAVGGINEKNLAEFFNVGVAGVGIGGDLVNLKLIQENKFDEITILAKKYTEQI